MLTLQTLGLVGRVWNIRASGDVCVAVNGSRWVYNPKCITKAPGETPIEETTGKTYIRTCTCTNIYMYVHVHVYTCLEQYTSTLESTS